MWWGSKKDTEKSSVEENVLPDDLSKYLENKESQLSDREFKSLLKRQSQNAELARKAEEDLQNVEGKFVDLIAGNQQNGTKNDQQKGPEESIVIPVGLTTINEMKKPREYTNVEFEKYKREHDEKEIILTNCSEIQNAFFNCLGKQTIWDRLGSIGRLENDDCTKLADFFVACRDIQKKAFLMFEYSSLENVEEMKTAQLMVDQVFNSNFGNIDDVGDKEKFLKYSRDLRNVREDFYSTFGK